MAIEPKLGRGRNGSRSINQALADLASLDSYTVATVPAAADHEGKIIHVSNGDAGAACLAYSDGASWLRISLGAAVAAA